MAGSQMRELTATDTSLRGVKVAGDSMRVHVLVLGLLMRGFGQTEAACSEQLGKTGKINGQSIKTSSYSKDTNSSLIFTDGWCADPADGDKWLEFDLGSSGMGFGGVIVSPLTSDPSNYPKDVLVQFAPIGSDQLQDLAFPGGKLEVLADKPTISNITFATGIAASRIRFILKDWNGQACMHVDIAGCSITELCGGVCQHGGVCAYENTCKCQHGYSGSLCEIEPCIPVKIPISADMTTVSSEDSFFSKDQLPKEGSNRGWCPSKSDKSPWLEVRLDKPLSVSVFLFDYLTMDEQHSDKEYMRDFELQYVAPTDSSGTFRTFAPNIPSLNGTHFFTVTTQPSMVTDRFRIVPTSMEKRACFKLEIKGCDPRGLCTTNFCQNGGRCMGDNICLCPPNYYGDNCNVTSTSIENYNLAFKKIENKILQTTTLNFIITGTVTLTTVDKINLISIKGPGSYIKLDQSTISTSCLADIEKCKTGFTIGLDIKFGKLVDNTFIISSGGNLPDHSGLALYFQQNHLIYVVSTSTQVWTLQVKYQPVFNKWQHFEITWNAKLGIGLLLDGHLLGTFGRPYPIAPATKKLDLCIGCSHTTSNVVVDMLVKGIQTWSLDRTNLVNAKIAQPPATTTTKPTTQLSITKVPSTKEGSSSNTVTTLSKSEPSTKIAVTTPTTTSEMTTVDKTPFQQYNLTFQSIIGNILITPAFNFTVHGHPKLELQEKGQTALVLNCSRQYVELPDKGIPCLENMGSCKNGFTVKLEVKFTSIDVLQKTYVLSSGGYMSGTSGTALYLLGNQFVFAVKQGMFHWVGTCNITSLIQTDVWYNIEVSWSMTGIIVYLDGKKVIDETKGTPYPGTSVTHPVLIGKTEGSNYTACMHVRNLFSWTASREILVSHGVVPAVPTTKSPSTTKAVTTTTDIPTTTTPTTTTTAEPTTTEKLTTSTTTPTTTEPPIVEFLWNFTNTAQINTTVHGVTSIKEGGMAFHNSSQYIDFGNKLTCLTNPDSCHKGLTIQFTIQFKKLEENTYLLTSGGETPNGVGLAVVYRYGRLQFILTTVTNSWFASCGRDKLLPNGYHLIMISWHQTTGLKVYIDNYLIDSSKVPVPHETAVVSVSTSYFGKPHFTISTSVKIEYLVQSIHIWYVRLEILIEKGICKPPSEVSTTTARPTTVQQTSPTSTKRTPIPTFSSSLTPTTVKQTTQTQGRASPSTRQSPKPTLPSSLAPTSAQQCPAGCISIGSSGPPSSTVVATSSPTQSSTQRLSSPPSSPSPTKPKPSATSGSTFPPTPPLPNTATPAKATTARTIPEYHEIPTIHALVGKDKNAYLACTFKGATETDVVLTVSLLIDNKIVLTQIVPGNTGIFLFSVAKIDDNLHRKKIRCSLKASYAGSTLTTVTTFSNIFTPQFQVTPNRLTVTEGHSAGHVTVTSTAPPQFYCCKGCKGVCQIHIVTSWTYDRHDLKCGKKVIAQAVIGSQKPRNFSKYICGFALTIDNWNQGNPIPVKATIDGRRDGDHRNSLTVKANVYNQPVGVAITVRPAVNFNIATVQVLIKDNDRSTSTCKSVNDPHMTTFDGQRYDNMHEGQYVLYRHKSLPFEVRADYKKCSSRSHATCNCAVAVKSGDDVITIAGCQDKYNRGIGQVMQQLFGHHVHGHHDHGHARTPMTIQMYINGQLTPGTYIRRYGCGQKYEIELPTGTVITVQQSYKPFINIWIKASSSDWEHTEGLCGSYDGHKTNDLKLSTCNKPCVGSFIDHWKVSVTSHFFYGVGVSSQVTGGMYCSCVQGKESICSAGLGVMKCTKSRYDVTAVLVQQAKRPILTMRTKRQVASNTTTAPTATDSGVSLEEAEAFCKDAIMNSTVTQSCSPIMPSNISDRIEDCAKDYNATGLKVWALDHIRDIAFDCVNAAQGLIDETADNSTNSSTVDIQGILANACVDACVHGQCSGGICECEVGYSGETCNISRVTKPDVASVPYLCDISQTVDCKLVMVYGNNFVASDDLTCHYQLVEITNTVQTTGTVTKSKAAYISLNQVACILPSLHSATVKISNDGMTVSDASAQHVVYNSICHDCYVLNGTLEPRCDRKEYNCIINGVCYDSHETSPENSCQMCIPDTSNSSWSRSHAAECVGVPLRQTDAEEMERTQIIILAVVCAVFGVLIIGGIIYIFRKRTQKNRKKASDGYEVAAFQKPDVDDKGSTAVDNPIYDYKL